MMRRMCGTGGEVDEERLIRRQRLLETHPVDCLIGHVRGEVVVGVFGRLHFRGSVMDNGCPLVRLATDEAVELVEAAAGRPAIEWAGRTDFPRWHFVVLAKCRCAVTVQTQHLRHRSDAFRSDPLVAGEGRSDLLDGTAVR